MITGQHIYLGPRLNAYGIGYAAVFYNGRHPRLQEAIDHCPSVAQLLVPVAEAGRVMRELNFDYAHNMKGGTGKHPTFYREIERWLIEQQSPSEKRNNPNINLQHA
jgi:hypothetical protein